MGRNCNYLEVGASERGIKNDTERSGMVAHAYKSSYLGGRDRRITV
jgi:hypothetical protein